MKKIVIILTLISTHAAAKIELPNLPVKLPQQQATQLKKDTAEINEVTDSTRAANPNQISGKKIKAYILNLLEQMCKEIGTAPHLVSMHFCAEYEARCDYVLEKLNCIMTKYDRTYVTPEEIEQETRKTMDLFFQRVRYANINKLAKEMLEQHRNQAATRSNQTACSKFEYNQQTAQELAQYLLPK